MRPWLCPFIFVTTFLKDYLAAGRWLSQTSHRGTVALAGWLGIYGNCAILDGSQKWIQDRIIRKFREADAAAPRGGSD